VRPEQRTYLFVYAVKDRVLQQGSTQLQGPVWWRGAGGKDYEVYERHVPKAFECVALTEDQTAMGRVYDERGLVEARPKAQRRHGAAYLTRQSIAHHAHRKLKSSPVCLKAQGARSRFAGPTAGGLDDFYIFAPGRGLVHGVNQGR
jgi:hypothetical protein